MKDSNQKPLPEGTRFLWRNEDGDLVGLEVQSEPDGHFQDYRWRLIGGVTDGPWREGSAPPRRLRAWYEARELEPPAEATDWLGTPDMDAIEDLTAWLDHEHECELHYSGFARLNIGGVLELTVYGSESFEQGDEVWRYTSSKKGEWLQVFPVLKAAEGEVGPLGLTERLEAFLVVMEGKAWERHDATKNTVENEGAASAYDDCAAHLRRIMGKPPQESDAVPFPTLGEARAENMAAGDEDVGRRLLKRLRATLA